MKKINALFMLLLFVLVISIGSFLNVEASTTTVTDYTPRSCNIDGSASPTGIKCGTPLNTNEDYTDATSDSCADSTIANPLMWIEDMHVSATTVKTTDSVQVTCDVKCYGPGTEYAILYNSGSGWVTKQYGNCMGNGIESKTINIDIDDVPGTHYFRCWESWYVGGPVCISTTTCCSNPFADNDDMSITVIPSCIPTTTTSTTTTIPTTTTSTTTIPSTTTTTMPCTTTTTCSSTTTTSTTTTTMPYCGDGIVQLPEECELPGTEDSEYCPCHEDECKGDDYYDYPDYGYCKVDCTCNIGTYSCNGPCKPTIHYNDPKCTTTTTTVPSTTTTTLPTTTTTIPSTTTTTIPCTTTTTVPGTTTTTIPSCTDVDLGNPIVDPSSPIENQIFQIKCEALEGIECIRAYANDDSNECVWIEWRGSTAIFDCTGMSAGDYIAKCKSVTGTSSNCCLDEKTNTYTIVTATTTTTTTSTTTTTIPGEVDGLVINSVDVKINGDSDKNLKDGDKIGDEAKPGDTIEFSVEVENTLEDLEIENIEVDITIKDIDDGDDLDEEADEFDLKAGKDEEVEIEFDIPLDVDESTFDVIITAEGEDENGTTHEARFELQLEVEKGSHEIIIRRAALTPSTVSCEREITLNVGIINIGSKDEDDVTLKIMNYDLDINSVTSGIELDEGTSDNKFTKTISEFLSDDLPAGIYPIKIDVNYDGKSSDSKTVELTIQKCEPGEEREDIWEEGEGKVEVMFPETVEEGPIPSATGFAFFKTGKFNLLWTILIIILIGLLIFIIGAALTFLRK